MDYSKIRNAIDREIHLGDLSQGCLCTLDGPGYYILHIDTNTFSVEIEVLGLAIYTIKSSAMDTTASFYAKLDKLDNTGKFFFSTTSSTQGNTIKVKLGVEYTTDSLTVNTDKTIETTYAETDRYSFGKIYVLKPLQFDGTRVDVNSLHVKEANITNFTANNATLNLGNNNVENIGLLHAKNAKMEVLDVDTLHAGTIDSTTVKLGGWTLTKSSDGATITVTAPQSV